MAFVLVKEMKGNVKVRPNCSFCVLGIERKTDMLYVVLERFNRETNTKLKPNCEERTFKLKETKRVETS